jgi:DNA-binding protein HU-beta
MAGSARGDAEKAVDTCNPRTGEPVTVAASRQPKFKAGKALEDALN